MIDGEKQQTGIHFFNKSRQRTTLNVIVEKIGKASATVRGDLSKETLRELLMSELSLVSKSYEKSESQNISVKEIPEKISNVIQEINKQPKEEIPSQTNNSFSSEIKDLKISAEKEEKQKEIEKENEIEKQVLRSEDEDEDETIVDLNIVSDRSTTTFKGKIKDFTEKEGNQKQIEKHGHKDKDKKMVDLKNISTTFKSKIKDVIEKEEKKKKTVDLNNISKIPSTNDIKYVERENHLSEGSTWLKEYLEKPLILGIKEIIEKKPYDPVNYLGLWLLNYRNCEKNLKNKQACLKNELLDKRNKRNLLQNQIKKSRELILGEEDESFCEEESAEDIF